MGDNIKKSVSWKNNYKSNTNTKKSSFFSKLKKFITRKNSTKPHNKYVFPNTVENVEARKSIKVNRNSNNNNNNNNSTRKIFFNTAKNLRKQHYRNRIAKTLYRGKYFIEENK